jgi:hypothetical protein
MNIPNMFFMGPEVSMSNMCDARLLKAIAMYVKVKQSHYRPG